jgi:hypothetical protein
VVTARGWLGQDSDSEVGNRCRWGLSVEVNGGRFTQEALTFGWRQVNERVRIMVTEASLSPEGQALE